MDHLTEIADVDLHRAFEIGHGQWRELLCVDALDIVRRGSAAYIQGLSWHIELQQNLIGRQRADQIAKRASGHGR